MSRLLLLSLLGALAAARTAAADFDFPGGKEPTELLRYADLDRPGVQSEQSWKVWVAYEGLRPLWGIPGKSKNADPVPGVVFTFMQPCYIAERYQSAGTEYLFLAKADETGKKVAVPYGWVDKAFVVEHNQALRDPKTTIHRKAMLVNTEESLGSAADLFTLDARAAQALDAETVPAEARTAFEAKGAGLSPESRVEKGQAGKSWTIIDPRANRRFTVHNDGDRLGVRDSLVQAAVLVAPDPAAPRRTTYQLFNIFFVYGEARDYVLLGSATSFGDDARTVVQGWIPSSRITPWNNREALEWDRPSTVRRERAERGCIWHYPEDAYAWLHPKKELPKPLFQENFKDDNTSLPFTFRDMRFPILDWPRNAKVRQTDAETTNELLRVGWVGGWSGSNGLSDAQRQELSDQLADAKESLKQLDLIFVIDDTFSMNDYLRPTGEAVEAIIRDAQQRKDLRFRVAVSYYNDEPDPKPLNPMPLKDVSDTKEMDTLIKMAKDHTYHDGGDPPEMVFAGIKAAIDESGYNPKARKVIIVIGDACDKSKEGNDRHDKKNEIVRKLFPAAGTPFEFYAIHMEPPVPPDQRDPVAVLHEVEMRAIVRLVNERAKKGEVLAAYAPAANIDALKTAIDERFKLLQKQVEDWSRQLVALQRGEFHTEIAPGLEEYLRKNHHIDLERLRRVEGGQIYQEGYVWRYARTQNPAGRPVAQVRPCALLSEGDVKELIRVLKALVGSDSTIRTRNLSSLVVAEVQRLTNEAEYKGQSLKQALFIANHGLDFRSPLLSKSAEELTAVDERDVRDLKVRLRRLEDLVAGQQQDYKWEQRKQDSGEVKLVLEGNNLVKFRRYSEIPGDSAKWYWVDVDEELP